MTATLRCAIYTRVSSDAGLEQDFNSLDAQRELAEAYIKSQAHEGWRLVRERFDDGGYSGGSTDRPALQRLLDRIGERRVDVVVVYKVDRLTRSLADFAKLVELFDAQSVSFVSVTQAFNTTTSMGRLTLNVLLSFAQFEREVTGERIRDKIAASKKKGLWMGGVVPLGYRLDGRKLSIDESEAAAVRLIFNLYLQFGSVRALQRELKRRDIRTRVRVLASGQTVGGVHLTNGPLSHILRNRHYLGEINHHGRSWPGEHAAIIDRATFDQVQARLGAQRVARTARLSSRALLRGKIFNEAGERLTPTYAMKGGVRYGYYVSTTVMQSRDCMAASTHRLPAAPLEAVVVDALRRTLETSDPLGTAVDAPLDIQARGSPSELARANLRGSNPADLDPASGSAGQHAFRASRRSTRSSRDRLPPRLERSKRDQDALSPVDQAALARAADSFRAEDGLWCSTSDGIEERNRLTRGIATARSWVEALVKGSVADITELARLENRTPRSIRMTLSLAFLDPALVEAACAGTLPRGYGVTRLIDLPPRFVDQWRALGLSRSI